MKWQSMAWWGVVLSVACVLPGVAVARPNAGQDTKPGARQAPGAKPAADSQKDELTAAPVDPKTYIIGARDVLAIRIWREPEMSGGVVVRPDGKISLLLAGEVEAAGLTPEALAVRVAEAYSKILTKPEVSVSVTSVQSKRYFLSGNVGKTGEVALVTPTTMLQALSSAGLGQWAKKNKIIIMRGTQRIKFNYDEVLKGKRLEQNILLQDGDHIFVP